MKDRVGNRDERKDGDNEGGDSYRMKGIRKTRDIENKRATRHEGNGVLFVCRWSSTTHQVVELHNEGYANSAIGTADRTRKVNE